MPRKAGAADAGEALDGAGVELDETQAAGVEHERATLVDPVEADEVIQTIGGGAAECAGDEVEHVRPGARAVRRNTAAEECVKQFGRATKCVSTAGGEEQLLGAAREAWVDDESDPLVRIGELQRGVLRRCEAQ